MKRLLFLLPLVMIYLQGCQDEEQFNVDEVQFSLDIAAEDSDSRIDDFPDKLSAQVTICSNGIATRTIKDVVLTRTGSRYQSEPMVLNSGKYEISQIIINDDQFVAVPTSSGFTVGMSNDKNISIGYTARQNTAKKTTLFVTVYTEHDGKKKFADARAAIFNEQGEWYEFVLAAKPNHLAFQGDPNAQYTLLVDKDGYELHYETFTYNDLARKKFEIVLQEKPIIPETTIVITPGTGYFSMWLGFTGAGTITLDWGNGEMEHVAFNVDPENETSTGFIYRDRESAGTVLPVKITGDVHLVTSFDFSNVAGFDGEYASFLRSVSFLDSDIQRLDLEHNTELKYLSLDLSAVHEVILPQQHAINSLLIDPSSAWTDSGTLDYIIDNIHVNTVAYGVIGGSFRILNRPISEASAAKLEELENSYGWSVEYTLL
jgi:hypothetical protein